MGSNFTAVVGPCGAKNQKMVLTNVVQDDILYLKMNCQHILQKFPYPNNHQYKSESILVHVLVLFHCSACRKQHLGRESLIKVNFEKTPY